MKTDFVPRVNQLDAFQLDNDIIRIVRDQLAKALENLSPGLLSRFQPELDLILRAAIWNYSIGYELATFGQQLLFITYNKDQMTSTKYTLHFIFNVMLKYFKDVAAFRLTANLNVQNCLEWSENMLVICNLLNFFRFLHTGKQASIIDYLLGLDSCSMYGNKRRDIGYGYYTRELVWGGFMELLGFTLPLVNYHSVKRKLRNLLRFSRKSIGFTTGKQLPVLTLTTKCGYCNERPTLPYHIGCSHVFCYYCLQGNVMADSNFQCPLCDATVVDVQPVVSIDSRAV